MGIYLNPGFFKFSKARKSSIFVDKTEMILYTNSVINTNNMYISVSRPRRFGKTMAANMLCAYYEKDKPTDLFNDCKVSEHDDWKEYLGKFDVINLVMTDFFRKDTSISEALKELQVRVSRELIKKYPDVDYYDPEDLVMTMENIFAEKNIQFVIIIDEWDAIFRACKEDKDGQKEYLDFLRNWLKDKDYVALVYMTGILPIKKYGEHSALNMFDEYSMISPMQLAPYMGFTEKEVMNLC